MFSFLRRSKRLLFTRNYQGYTGGHQKVFDYYTHAQLVNGWQPAIHFTPSSVVDDSFPWPLPVYTESVAFEPRQASALFLAGLDWQQVQPSLSKSLPVINFIQHVRHADANLPLRQYLSRKAIRICVSQQVSEAILATGEVNGPVVTIANGHDVGAVPVQRDRAVFVLGGKQPQLTRELQQRLSQQGVASLVFDSLRPRQEVMQAMASSSVSVLLPNNTEGFYLPALESMALSDVTIVADCVGNRGFCYDQKNCIIPRSLSGEDYWQSILQALATLEDQSVLKEFKWHAQSTVAQHSLERERREFHDVLDNLFNMW